MEYIYIINNVGMVNFDYEREDSVLGVASKPIIDFKFI